MYTDGGVLSGWGCETSNRAYGLNDPSLEGFPGSIFKVIAAPFKVTAKVVKTAVKTAVRVAPGAVAGFVTAGPAGAIAGGVTALVPRKGSSTQYTATPVQSVGTYPRSDSAFNPYGVTAQPYPQSAMQYQQPYQAPTRSVGDQITSMVNLLKDELLAAGARRVAETPQGQAAIREKVSGDIGRYLLPISIGAGALVLVLAMTRRPRPRAAAPAAA
jgi:hypothetical protein